MPASQRSAERLSATEQQQQPPPHVAMASSSLAEKHHHQTAAAPAAADRSFGGNGECCASGASFLSGRVFCDMCVAKSARIWMRAVAVIWWWRGLARGNEYGCVCVFCDACATSLKIDERTVGAAASSVKDEHKPTHRIARAPSQKKKKRIWKCMYYILVESSVLLCVYTHEHTRTVATKNRWE